MEPNQNQGQSQEPVEAPMPEQNAFPQGPVTEKKTGNGMLIGMILCALIALGGVGFGVWAMMDGNAQKEQLNSQISALRDQINEMQEEVSIDSDGDIDINGDTDNVDVANYIYVGEWGLKIKKPENWRELVTKYEFINDYPLGTDSLEIRESYDDGDGVIIVVGGASCEVQGDPQYGVCFEVGDKVVVVTELVYQLSQGVASPMSEEFRTHFMNPENYSEI